MNSLLVTIRFLSISAFIILLMSKSVADSVTYMWSATPLDIDLQVGNGRNIHIPDAESLRVGIPFSIDDRLTPQIIGNHLWLNALDEFNSTRVILIAEPLGRLILQIQARYAETSSQPIVIKKIVSDDTSKPQEQQPNHGYVALTRLSLIHI